MEEAGFLFTDFYFNSLPHAEVDSDAIKPEIENRKFQLTTSRRGRRDDIVITGINIIFQLTTSRRGRPDDVADQIAEEEFQLTTSRRGRQLDLQKSAHDQLFQLTTSRRGRLIPEGSKATAYIISTHYLTQR